MQTHAAGWDTLRLFGVDPETGTLRDDFCGILIPLSVDIHEDHTRVDQAREVDGLPARAREAAGHDPDLRDEAMTGGDAYQQKVLTDDAITAAIAAYLADPSAPAIVEIGNKRRAVLDLLASSLSDREIARRVGVSPQTVGNIRRAP